MANGTAGLGCHFPTHRVRAPAYWLFLRLNPRIAIQCARRAACDSNICAISSQ